ncbi:hypothetical protein ACLB2K_007890 [Fragaria x ananassa]
MSDEVAQHFVTALAITVGDRPLNGAARVTAAPPHVFAVGRLLSLSRHKPDPRASIGTLTSVWDLQNRLQMRANGDQYVMRFTKAEDKKMILGGGSWFFGRSLFVLAEYDGLHDVAVVSIVSFPVWVEIMGLPPRLFTDEATEKVGLTGTVAPEVQVDKLGVKRGIRVRVRASHHFCDPILEVFPNVPFEFGSQRFLVNLKFNYNRTVCRDCGMLEHSNSGCEGPPVLQPRFIEIESMDSIWIGWFN